MESGPIAIEAIKKIHHGDLVRLDRGAASPLGAHPCSPYLRLPRSTGERMPAALTLAGHGIMVIKDDCPTAGRALTKMAFHFLRLLLSELRSRLRWIFERTPPPPRPYISDECSHDEP